MVDIFRELFLKHNKVCKMVWGQIPYKKEFIRTFLSDKSFSKSPFLYWDHPVPKLIAGCWNFFKMNDMKPQKDFRLVSYLYPPGKLDCYSVGFLQPYLMHTELNCKNLNMIDADWRIHEAHWQLLEEFFKGKFTTEEEIEKDLPNLRLGWIARFDGKPMEASTDVNLNTVCFKSHHSVCKKFISAFQARYRSIKTINLQLSFLHSGDYTTKKDTIPVIYLSNAIDTIYTSQKQFDLFLDSVKKGLPDKGKAVFIYHSAGRDNFGIYELERRGEAYKVRTVCKDIYYTSPVHKIQRTFSTYFERIRNRDKVNKKISCQQLFLEKTGEKDIKEIN